MLKDQKKTGQTSAPSKTKMSFKEKKEFDQLAKDIEGLKKKKADIELKLY